MNTVLQPDLASCREFMPDFIEWCHAGNQGDTIYGQVLRRLDLWSARSLEGDPQPTIGGMFRFDVRAIFDGGYYFDRFGFREELTRWFSWAVPTYQAIKRIGKYGPILEVGAGNGYWSHEIRRLTGADVLATDLDPGAKCWRKQWFPVQKFDAMSPVANPLLHGRSLRTLLMVWPNYDDPWAARALAWYEVLARDHREGRVIYVGEGPGGCTADDEFHERIANTNSWREVEDFRIAQWDGIHDYGVVYDFAGAR